MFKFDLSAFFNKNTLKRYRKAVSKINDFYASYKENKTIVLDELRAIKNNEGMKDEEKILRAMALAKLASEQVMGMPHYDVQLMGAIALTDGLMAEMKTGEGKTLTCVAAVAANHVLGYTTHIATANEYLAQRDEMLLSSVYMHMGLTSAHNLSTMDSPQKREAYRADVVYSTAQEFGFDYLRDNLRTEIQQRVQPISLKSTRCIVDEADFVLIDEARTPLIISGSAPVIPDDTYKAIRGIAMKLKRCTQPFDVSVLEERVEDGDFWVDEKYRSVTLSESGYNKLEKELLELGLLDDAGLSNIKIHSNLLYHEKNLWLTEEVLNALKAEYLYKRDKEYVIMNDEVVIVDQNTGRLSPGRSWSNGLHQAVEAKEGVKINPETQTIGTITIQNYLKVYSSISGMSGTIMDSSVEFEEIYGCGTVSIPTNKPVQRKDHIDLIYITKEAKYRFLLKEIQQRHEKGQPLLIGTTSVGESEIISKKLNEIGLKHYVINAKSHALEAQIIAQAGCYGAITVATSMAGRGTDIILGGNKEELLKTLDTIQDNIQNRLSFVVNKVQSMGIHNEETPFEELPFINEEIDNVISTLIMVNELFDDEKLSQEIEEDRHLVWNRILSLLLRIAKQREYVKNNFHEEREKVVKAGGLCVIGSSRNESRRIDNQLKGRAGRQGDVGESVFYMSLEDEWVSIFGKNKMLASVLKNVDKNALLSDNLTVKMFAKAQATIEKMHADERKNTYKYDVVTDESRVKFLEVRNEVLLHRSVLIEMAKGSLKELLECVYMPSFSDVLAINKEAKEAISADTLDGLLNTHQSSEEDVDVKKILNETPLNVLIELARVYTQTQHYAYDKELVSAEMSELDEFIKELFYCFDNDDVLHLQSSFVKVLDKHWISHLAVLSEAQGSVGLTVLAQKNPLYEFKNRCFESFNHHFLLAINDLIDLVVERYAQRIVIIKDLEARRQAMQNGVFIKPEVRQLINHDGDEYAVDGDGNNSDAYIVSDVVVADNITTNQDTNGDLVVTEPATQNEELVKNEVEGEVDKQANTHEQSVAMDEEVEVDNDHTKETICNIIHEDNNDGSVEKEYVLVNREDGVGEEYVDGNLDNDHPLQVQGEKERKDAHVVNG